MSQLAKVRLYWELVGIPTIKTTASITKSPPASLVFLHGLLGNGRNVRTLARRFCQQQDRVGLLLDLRGHGKSHLLKDQSTITASTSFQDCARDIEQTFQQDQGLVSSDNDITFVGHSLGGRISLQYGFDQLNPRPNRIWLLDTFPGSVNHDVQRILEQLSNFMADHPDRSSLSTRTVADMLIHSYNIDKATSQWLASSFRSGQFDFDLQVAQELLTAFEQQDFLMQLDQVLESGIQVDLVRAGRNPVWDLDENSTVIQQLNDLQQHDNFRQHVLPNAGHWVHVDDLEGLLRIMNTP